MPDNATIETIKAIGAIITPIVLAFIAYKQIALSKKQDAIRKDVDGKMAQLLETTGAKERAEGKLEQQAETKAEVTPPIAPTAVVDVKIVDQDKVIKVKSEDKEPDKN